MGEGGKMWEKAGEEECTYRRGDRFGQGRMEYTNGDIYDGKWDRDHFHGHGSFANT